LGKKNAWAEDVIIVTDSIATKALIKCRPMKEAFPIGGLLSFPGGQLRGSDAGEWPFGQLANSSLIQNLRELQS
jgi:hypothetical protein